MLQQRAAGPSRHRWTYNCRCSVSGMARATDQEAPPRGGLGGVRGRVGDVAVGDFTAEHHSGVRLNHEGEVAALRGGILDRSRLGGDRSLAAGWPRIVWLTGFGKRRGELTRFAVGPPSTAPTAGRPWQEMPSAPNSSH